MEWAILVKFGKQIVFDVLNCDTWPKWKAEADLRCYGWAAILNMDMTAKLGCKWFDLNEIWCANAESHAADDENINVKPEVKFQYGGRSFSQTGNSNISIADWATLAKFDVQIV